MMAENRVHHQVGDQQESQKDDRQIDQSHHARYQVGNLSDDILELHCRVFDEALPLEEELSDRVADLFPSQVILAGRARKSLPHGLFDALTRLLASFLGVLLVLSAEIDVLV